MFGSHVLWNDLLTAGLVDELHFMIGSAVLGDGVPMFTGPRTNCDSSTLASSRARS